jgi:hypothetical protein
MKPSRRRKGATLGLVAACALVIIVLGFGVFYLAKLYGGGREVANATDAGTLNVAKNALVQPAVQLPAPTPGSNTPMSEFYGCAYPAANGSTATIDLFTYNRCVGQALLIALNAKAEADAGSTTAMGNAQSVLNDLNAIGKSLANGIDPSRSAGTLTFDPARPAGCLTSNFTQSANKNNIGMYNTSTIINQGGYATAFMKAGGATNVWFSDQVLGTNKNLGDSSADFPSQNGGGSSPKLSASTSFLPTTTNPTTSTTGQYYLQGYNPISVTANGTTLTFYGVPIFPQQKPHLVSLSDFNQSATAPDPNTPPNAMKVASAAQLNSNMGGAVACALVGAAFSNTGTATPPDFPVAIPSGYIALVNAPYSTAPNASSLYPNAGDVIPASFYPALPGTPGDATNQGNIFNNELMTTGNGGGLSTSGGYGTGDVYAANAPGAPGGVTGVFGDQTTIAAWIAYNASSNASNAVTHPQTPGVYTSGSNPGGTAAAPCDPALYPPTHGLTPPSNLIFDSNGVQASVQACLAITGSASNCSEEATNNNPTPLTGPCNQVPAMTIAYGHGYPAPQPGSNYPGGVSAVDAIKGAILANFDNVNGANYHSSLTIDASGSTLAVSAGGLGNGLKTSTGLGEYMSPNGMLDVFAVPNNANQNKNNFPMQATGGSVLPQGGNPSILGLLAQLDAGNGPAASGTGGTAPNNNYTFNRCGNMFQQIVQRVQQIQPNATAADVEKLLNGSVAVAGGGTQYGLQMGQTAYIYLNNADLTDASGIKGLHIVASSNPSFTHTGFVGYTNVAPDGVPGSASASTACTQQYSLYNGGGLTPSTPAIQGSPVGGTTNVGFINVSNLANTNDGPNPLGDANLHWMPYTQVSGEYTATDMGQWTPSSGYGNLLGQLNFSDTVSGSASFSAPN